MACLGPRGGRAEFVLNLGTVFYAGLEGNRPEGELDFLGLVGFEAEVGQLSGLDRFAVGGQAPAGEDVIAERLEEVAVVDGDDAFAGLDGFGFEGLLDIFKGKGAGVRGIVGGDDPVHAKVAGVKVPAPIFPIAAIGEEVSAGGFAGQQHRRGCAEVDGNHGSLLSQRVGRAGCIDQGCSEQGGGVGFDPLGNECGSNAGSEGDVAFPFRFERVLERQRCEFLAIAEEAHFFLARCDGDGVLLAIEEGIGQRGDELVAVFAEALENEGVFFHEDGARGTVFGKEREEGLAVVAFGRGAQFEVDRPREGKFGFASVAEVEDAA